MSHNISQVEINRRFKSIQSVESIAQTTEYPMYAVFRKLGYTAHEAMEMLGYETGDDDEV